MIHQLLTLTRPLFVLDTETTGVDPQKDRIVEIGFQMWEGGGPCKNCENYRTALASNLVKEIPPCDHCKGSGHVEGGMTREWRSLVDPGVPIPESATKVHGITNERLTLCRECGRRRQSHHSEPNWDNDIMMNPLEHPDFKPVPKFKDLAQHLAKGFTNCDWAGQNVRFDLRILSAEMQRAGVEWSYLGARIVDSSRLEALAVPRSLSHLHQKYVGHRHDGAHGALSDVRAAATVIAHQLKTHQMLPRDLDILHKAQWPDEWLDGDGKFKMVNGVATCTFGKYRGITLRNIPVDYLDWLIKSDFPPDVKRLASDAKIGKFPDGTT